MDSTDFHSSNYYLTGLANQIRDHGLSTSFSRFIVTCFTTLNPSTHYLTNWHIELIAETLRACERGQITRLIVNMPPRALKSLSISVAWPAWLLAHNPSARIIAASYSGALSLKHSLDCRQLITSSWYRRLFPGTQLARDQNEKHKFSTKQNGFRFATSVGGTLTGEGGNFLIVDDPQTPSQAARRGERERVNQWFDTTLVSRLDDKRKGVIVLVMQRLHEQDLTGHLLQKGGWMHLCLPARFEVSRTFTVGDRKFLVCAGDMLHATREDEILLARTREELGSHAFAAQYLQRPVPEGGAMLRSWWFGRYHMPPESTLRMVQSWDTAHKTGSGHDASVCVTVAEAADAHYIVDVQVMKLEYPELKKAVVALAEKWQADAILVEDKSSGQALLQDIRRGTRLPVIGVQPKTDKVTRFAAITALIEAGRVHLPKQASWLAEFETELLQFPHGAHDDQADALSQYLNWVRGRDGAKMRIRRL